MSSIKLFGSRAIAPQDNCPPDSYPPDNGLQKNCPRTIGVWIIAPRIITPE